MEAESTEQDKPRKKGKSNEKKTTSTGTKVSIVTGAASPSLGTTVNPSEDLEMKDPDKGVASPSLGTTDNTSEDQEMKDPGKDTASPSLGTTDNPSEDQEMKDPDKGIASPSLGATDNTSEEPVMKDPDKGVASPSLETAKNPSEDQEMKDPDKGIASPSLGTTVNPSEDQEMKHSDKDEKESKTIEIQVPLTDTTTTSQPNANALPSTSAITQQKEESKSTEQESKTSEEYEKRLAATTLTTLQASSVATSNSYKVDVAPSTSDAARGLASSSATTTEINKSKSPYAEDMCGVCKKVFTHNEHGEHYHASCELCRRYLRIHKKCANALFSKTDMGKSMNIKNKSRAVSAEIFNQQKTVGLMCYFCLDDCFYCKKRHPGGGTISVVCSGCNLQWCRCYKPKEPHQKPFKHKCQNPDAKAAVCSLCSKTEHKDEQVKNNENVVLDDEVRMVIQDEGGEYTTNPPQLDNSSALDMKPILTKTIHVDAKDNHEVIVILDDDEVTKVKEEQAEKMTSTQRFERYVTPRSMKINKDLPMDEWTIPIYPVLPSEKRKEIIHIIKTHFGFHDGEGYGELNSNFKSLEQIREECYRTFSFIEDDNTNIMKLRFPPFMKDIIDKETYEFNYNIGLEVCWSSVKRVIDNDWLDDKMINFVFDCFNLLKEEETHKATMPDLVFGHTWDSSNVIPTAKECPTLMNSGNEGSDAKPEKEQQNVENIEKDEKIAQELKRWYCFTPKGRIQKVLDFCQATGTKLNNYAGIVNVNDNHWIYIKYDAKYKNQSSGKTYPSILTFDSTNPKNSSSSISTRKWYSKFFGLVNKEMNQRQNITTDDMNGNDLSSIENFNGDNNNDTLLSSIPSILEVDNMPVRVPQTDSYNCGIFCLIKAWEDCRNQEYCQTLIQNIEGGDEQKKDPDQMMKDFCARFRITLASLVYYLYQVLYSNKWDPYRHLIRMEQGDINEGQWKENLQHWKDIMKLINKGTYKVKYDPIEGEDVTVNTLYKDLTLEEVKQDITQLTSNVGSTKTRGRKRKAVQSTTSPRNRLRRMNTNEENLPSFLAYFDAIPSRTEFVYNVSNFKITLERDESRMIAERNATYYSPIQFKDMIKQCVLQRFQIRPSETDEDNAITRERSVAAMETFMEQYDNYVLLGIDNTTSTAEVPPYCIKAVMIIENHLEVDSKDSSMIHFIAIANDVYYNEREMTSFIHQVFRGPELRSKPVLAVAKNTEFDYLPITATRRNVNPWKAYKDLLSRFGFKRFPREYQKFDDILPQGSVVWNTKADILCKDCPLVEHDNVDYRIVMIDHRLKCRVRFNSQRRIFEMFSYPFGWKQCTENDLKYMNNSQKRKYRNNPDEVYELKGGGHREGNIIHDENIGHLVPLNSEFNQTELEKYHGTESSCMWLSACYLVDSIDKEEASKMIKMLKLSPRKYDWMHMFKQHGEQKGTSLLLSEHIRDHTKFQLDKVKGISPIAERLVYLLKDSTKGQYICQLRTKSNQCSHVIGVDCDQKLIYDCMETHKLTLTKENLDHCCGPNTNGLAEIAYWGKLEPKRMMKKQHK